MKRPMDTFTPTSLDFEEVLLPGGLIDDALKRTGQMRDYCSWWRDFRFGNPLLTYLLASHPVIGVL